MAVSVQRGPQIAPIILQRTFFEHMHAQPSLMFATAHWSTREGHDPLENRCTELLATLVERHEEVAAIVLNQFGLSNPKPIGAATAETQVTIRDDGPARGRCPDLVMCAPDGREVWVEVKVDAVETNCQLRSYRNHIAACDSPAVLSTLSKTGSSAFPSMAIESLPNGGKHVRWSELARSLLSLAELGQFLDRTSLVDRDLSLLQSEIAQFLVYLSEQGVMPMTEPVSPEDLALVAEAAWVGPLRRTIALFKSSTIAAAREAGLDDGWRQTSLPATREMSYAQKDDADKDRLWIWRNFARKADDENYNAGLPFLTIEATLCDGAYWTSDANRELGIVWGLYLRNANYSSIKQSDPAFASAAAVAADISGLSPAIEDNGWRFNGFLRLSEVLEHEAQQESLTASIAPRLRVLRQAIEAHFPT